VGIAAPVSLNGLEAALTLKLLASEFPRTADGFGLLARFLDRRLLEMLLELHFAEHAFALELFLEGPKGLFDVIVADADLHVVVTTFLS
jgi:hypothetical protein